MIRRFTIGCIGLAANLFASIAWASTDIEILVVHSQNQLVVKQKDTILRTFHVALGSGGREHKQYEGDRRTPKGQYRIMQVRDSDRFHTFMHINYPNMDDAKQALKDGRISIYDYRKILHAHVRGELPPQNTALGGVLGIHGIGEETPEKLDIHDVSNWTQGCIALRNHEVTELLSYISEGTTVTIVD